MRRYHWPGNSQELLNVMERAALVAESDRLEIDDLLSNAVESGAQLGSYQLVERIGAGGMGEVWRARHKLLRRPAAIKLIPWENFGHAEGSEDGAILRKRFEREAQVTAALQSPNTVQLFDYGTSETGTFFYVMELLIGLDLESAIKSHGPMPVERVIHVLSQACRSLAEAHSNGLVHRDIKAVNVYLCRLGLEVDFVKVLDFGLVRRVDGGSEDETRLTSQGSVGGTPAYMAPEVVLGEDTADHRVDIYALGCLAFWLLTGQLVFDAPTPVKMMFMHVKEPPIPPSELTEFDVPQALDDLILSMLAKRPDDRPESADAVMSALSEIDTEFRWSRARAQSWWEVHRL
jgi:serine/threonine-protein kinase